MNSLFLKNVIHSGKPVNIRIRNGQFVKISPDLLPQDGEEVFDGACRLAILPAFYNAHTHAAMTLMRGYADDVELFRWLNEFIWPLEAKLTPEDVYNGSRLAILEMIRTGTVFFNDMYWYQKETVRAAEEMGIRACIGMLQLSNAGANTDNEWLRENRHTFSSRIQTALAPHAIYTVDTPTLRKTAEMASGQNELIHIHLAETKREFDDCINQHNMTPVKYLDSLGLLTPRTILAHSIYLTEDDIRIIAERQSVPVHIPASNMKLASGRFPGEAILQHHSKIALGTDGACSNNNLSMMEEMKLAALLAKLGSENPETFPAPLVYDMASRRGADAFGIHAGVIQEGYLADAILVDLNTPAMTPNFHTISNMVYAADPSCIDSVICDGKFLMKHHVIDGEQEILAAARESAHKLVERLK